MKFVIKKHGLDYVDVSLPYQSKENIKNVLYWTTIAVIGVFASRAYNNHSSTKGHE